MEEVSHTLVANSHKHQIKDVAKIYADLLELRNNPTKKQQEASTVTGG